MKRIWRNKLFQSIVFILMASSLGIITSKLETVQLVLQNGNFNIENNIVMQLVEYIKVVRIVAIVIWGIMMGLYSNFIYSINKPIREKDSAES